MTWVIEYYKTPGGQEVVKSFIDGLRESESTKVARLLDLLEEYGYALGMPNVKSLGKGLMELRVRGKRGNQEVRIFYISVKDKKTYLLRGFIKKTQTTPKKELMKNPKFKAEYDSLETEYRLASELIAARISKKMTQDQVAEKAGVSRSVIARLESGVTNPTVGTVNRVANVLGKEIKLVGSS